MLNNTEQIERFRKEYDKALLGKWKGGSRSIEIHLKKRIKRGHLSEEATKTELIQKGLQVLKSEKAKAYEFIPSENIYFVVHKQWAVFFDEDVLWDTVFPPDVPDRYFTIEKGYELIGKLSELIK